jgi:UDP-N-acetylmuramoyl-tripeptide--D-alanyl-D-alanine ligase
VTARFTPQEAALAAAASVARADGPLHGGVFQGLFTDSRKPVPGALFVALTGERHDGAAFALQAVRDGAAGVLVQAHGSEQVLAALQAAGLPAFVLVCKDTTRALLGLGRAWRGKWGAGRSSGTAGLQVVAVTGSAGKTSTKELVASVLSQGGPTLKTEGNLNNEIGVPLTLLGLGETHRYAVIECGMNHLGEIARLGAAADPDVGLVTNVGPVHLEGCGSIEGVAAAKGELFHGLRAGATAVANADDPRVLAQALLSGRKLLTFGRSERADVRLVSAQHGGPGLQLSFSLGSQMVHAELQLVGLHNGLNACAAAAAGLALGLSTEAILHGLAAARTPGRRMRPSRLPGGALLLDDCYNANPSSTRAALETAASLVTLPGRALLVLGDMLELGPTELELHAGLGPAAAALGPALLVAFGRRAAALADAAIASGLVAAHVVRTDDPAAAAAAVQAVVQPGDVVLVKGSRGMKMERISDRLSGLAVPSAEGVH